MVATDDERIRVACEKFGAEVVMTSPDCANGTDRADEAVAKLKQTYDIVVNIQACPPRVRLCPVVRPVGLKAPVLGLTHLAWQGDEPLMEPSIIDAVVKALQARVASPACHAEAEDAT